MRLDLLAEAQNIRARVCFAILCSVQHERRVQSERIVHRLVSPVDDDVVLVEFAPAQRILDRVLEVERIDLFVLVCRAIGQDDEVVAPLAHRHVSLFEEAVYRQLVRLAVHGVIAAVLSADDGEQHRVDTSADVASLVDHALFAADRQRLDARADRLDHRMRAVFCQLYLHTLPPFGTSPELVFAVIAARLFMILGNAIANVVVLSTAAPMSAIGSA